MKRNASIESPAGDTSPILSIDGSIAKISLNRPSKRNCILSSDVDVIERYLNRIDNDYDIRALILEGRGPIFCSGFNLNEAATVSFSSSAEAPSAFARCVDRVQSLRVPSICRVSRGVYGGGVDLAAACDFRFGTKDCRIVIPGARIGLHYNFAGIRRMVELFGQQFARRILLIGQPVQSSYLLQCGFLSEIADEGEIDGRILGLAEVLSENGPLSVEGMKRTLNEILLGIADPSTANRRYAETRSSRDFIEGLAALNEKRKPNFTRT